MLIASLAPYFWIDSIVVTLRYFLSLISLVSTATGVTLDNGIKSPSATLPSAKSTSGAPYNLIVKPS